MFSTRKLRWQAALAVGLSAMGIGASSAVAAPAQFTQSGQNQMMLPIGTVSFSWGAGGPGQSRTCSRTIAVALGVVNSAGQGSIPNIAWNPTCTDGNGKAYTMNWSLSAPMLAQKNSGVFTLTSNGPMNIHDTGGTARLSALPMAAPYTLAWQNNTPTSKSSLIYANTFVTNVYDNVTGTAEQLRVTGTFEVGNFATFGLI